MQLFRPNEFSEFLKFKAHIMKRIIVQIGIKYKKQIRKTLIKHKFVFNNYIFIPYKYYYYKIFVLEDYAL